MKKINISDSFKSMQKHWDPEVIASLNGQVLRAVKGQGELGWHQHDDQDKLIIVFEGELILEFETENVVLGSGEMFVVEKGLRHCPKANSETHFIIFEPSQ